MKKRSFTLMMAALLSSGAVAQTKTAHKPAAMPATTPAPAASIPTPLPNEDTVNAFLYQTFGYDPTITWKVSEIRPSEAAGLAEVTLVLSNAQGSQVNKLYVTADGKHAITGEILPFGGQPYEEARRKLEEGVNGISKGPAHAPVMVVEFSDMQCPHCKQAAPNIEQLLALAPDVHFIFQNFPLPSHDWAEKAAGYVDCVGRASNEAVWKFIQKTFDEQANITAANADEKLKAIAGDLGLKSDEIAACAVKPDTKARIEASVALGKSVGVSGTPATFINGRPLGGSAPPEVMKRIVDFAANQAKGEGKPETSAK